jgi:hypothetical protein
MNLPAYYSSYKRRVRRAHERFVVRRRRSFRVRSRARFAATRQLFLLGFLMLVRTRLSAQNAAHALLARPT